MCYNLGMAVLFVSHHHAFSLLAGFLLDCILGDPHFFPHPVRFMGWMITFFEKRLHTSSDSAGIQKFKGFLTVFFVISLNFSLCFGILFVCKRIHPLLFFGVESLVCYFCLASRSLFDESMKVYKSLKKNDVEGSRAAVSMIVGRDTDVLDEKGIAKAAVETVAESTSDGVVAPMIFMALFGGAGGVVYKAINTLDSMIAYKNEKFLHFGFFAAKSDDIANFIPARISAILMIVATAMLSPCSRVFSAKNAVRIFFRDRRKHASPNSAQTESVMAGALGLQLAGDTVYDGIIEEKEYIGDKFREIEAKDIFRANVLMYGTSLLSVLGCVAGSYFLLA